MGRETYLRQLETALRKKCPEPQVKDILSDYEDFFATGIAEGKSEAELCTEFGPPEQAALELAKESTGDTRLRNKKWSAPVIVLLVIFIVAVLWPFFIPEIQVTGQSVPTGPVNFWLAMLFPLALESILVLLASQSNPPQKAPRWMPRVSIVLTVLITAALVQLVFYAFWISQKSALFETEGLFGTAHVLMAVTYCGTVISEILLLVLIVLLMLLAIKGHEKARWFLFPDTALLTLFLNLTSFLSNISTTSGLNSYRAATGVASCFLWAVLPNLAAAAVWWAIEKAISIRRARA